MFVIFRLFIYNYFDKGGCGRNLFKTYLAEIFISKNNWRLFEANQPLLSSDSKSNFLLLSVWVHCFEYNS